MLPDKDWGTISLACSVFVLMQSTRMEQHHHPIGYTNGAAMSPVGAGRQAIPIVCQLMLLNIALQSYWCAWLHAMLSEVF